MHTLEELKERLVSRKPKHVSDATGVSQVTIWRIVSGNATNVSYDTLKKLSDYLENNP